MTAEEIISLAHDLYGIEVGAERAAELAVEVSRLHASCRTAAAVLRFDDASWSHAERVCAGLRRPEHADER